MEPSAWTRLVLPGVDVFWMLEIVITGAAITLGSATSVKP